MFTASGTNAITYADLDGLENSLGPRFRSKASMVANRATYQRIRHFDAAGGRGAWEAGYQLEVGLPNQVPTPGFLAGRLIGYPAYESSAMSSTFTTGQLVGPICGDFSQMIIVDRIGLTTETIPHLFDVTNNLPTGQRGLYAYWRTGAGVSATAPFKILKLA
jgi:HK97 family phage major capsid protein